MRNLTFILIILVLGACSPDAFDNASPEITGQTSSTSRMTIIGNFMYLVDDSSITTFDITTPDKPVLVDEQNVGVRIETIFPFEDLIFIGSQQGMFIYGTEEGVPYKISEAQHFPSCDPVVANEEYAYVTLRSGSTCGFGGGFADVLEVYDIQEIERPQLVQQFWMTNPRGLSLSGNILFVCDYNEVKIFDVTSPDQTLSLFSTIPFDNAEEVAFDAIARGDELVLISSEALYQYDYSDLENIKLLSRTSIND